MFGSLEDLFAEAVFEETSMKRTRRYAVSSKREVPGKDPRAEPGLPYSLRKKPVGRELLQEQRETLY